MLPHPLRRRANIKPAIAQRLVFAGLANIQALGLTWLICLIQPVKQIGVLGTLYARGDLMMYKKVARGVLAEVPEAPSRGARALTHCGLLPASQTFAQQQLTMGPKSYCIALHAGKVARQLARWRADKLGISLRQTNSQGLFI